MARFRLTGITIGPASGQWERKDDDREIARRVVNLLADRRMLWKDFSREVEEHCVQSANEVRRSLGAHMDNPEISRHLAERVSLLQLLFRSFVDDLEHDGVDSWRYRWSSVGTDPLSVALGRLRGLVGVQVGALASDYDLEVPDDLARIVPDESGWFFERYGEREVPQNGSRDAEDSAAH